MLNLLFIFGTRPEAIKLAPLILEFKKNPEVFNVKVCVTGQHREMLYQVLDFFEIKPDVDLALMQKNQSLFEITSRILAELEGVLNQFDPNLVFVQGDTTSAFIGSLAAFYKQKVVVHVEAGLRSGDLGSPFPEEANRTLTAQLAGIHFTPTKKAGENLAHEGIVKNVFHVGNTVIDALLIANKRVLVMNEVYEAKFANIDFSKRLILITGHRRESFGEPFKNMCNAIRTLSETNRDCNFVYPVHFNPNVRNCVFEILSGIENVFLIEPLDYPSLVWLLGKSYLVLTDSGGIQEEAPALGKPVLVMRDVTERIEGIEAGTARLVGTNSEEIISSVKNLLNSAQEYNRMSKAVNPYGDGKSSERIVQFIRELI
ncbi:MAG: non-hydrolyzing UDP-N-acetylglucosamine 2-epimerase [Pyrinomonadaceae bacterium]